MVIIIKVSHNILYIFNDDIIMIKYKFSCLEIYDDDINM